MAFSEAHRQGFLQVLRFPPVLHRFNPSRTLWVQVHPYFHSSVHISITILAIMLKLYDFVDKGTDCVLPKLTQFRPIINK